MTCLLYSQDSEIPKGFYSYKLENGLEVYVQEDFTIPSMRIEYISKAGTGRQTQDTTGFFQLYSRLFWKNSIASQDDYKKIGAGDFTSQVGFSQSRYSFVVPSSRFSDSLKIFSDSLKHTRFTDANINSEYNALRQEVTAWARSVPGFINASIDAKIFANEPWTKDSGIYPALFSSYSTEEVRQKLSNITDKWYVPDQSALFITGPISANTILELVKANLSNWESSYIVGNTSDASKAVSGVGELHDENKLFVLVSSDFSKDYIQSVIQYTAPGLGATNTFSAVAWTSADIIQTKLIESGMTNTNTSFIADASDSRIIIQTLFDTQSFNDTTDISLMVPGFANIVKSTAQIINERDLNDSKIRASLYRNDSYTGAENFMEAIATNWAYGGVEYFFEWPKAVQNVTLNDVKQSFNDPWVFVLVHTDLYAKNKENFENFGYVEITENTGMWYTPYLENKETLAIQNNPITPELSTFTYTQYTKSLINEYTLSSDIPVVTQEIPATPWVSLLLTFNGGEILSGELKRGTEQIAITNVKNIVETRLSQQYFEGKLSTIPSVENDTGLYSSYISVVCLQEDMNSVLDVLSTTIQESIITIAAADELVISTAYNWSIQSGSLEYQLYAAAMETLYGGTHAQGMFNANSDILIQANYNDIRIATELLYDPKRISLVVTGSVPDTIKYDLERYFGKENFYPFEKQFRATIIEEQEPIFSPFEQIVRLRHTFLTDIPASLAGERPTKLIPTTDFSDPAQLYFEIPSFNDTEQALFASLLYDIADSLTEQFLTMRNPPAETVSVVPGTGVYPVSSLRFSKVKSKNVLKNMVQTSFDNLLQTLQSKDYEIITSIKSRYSRVLSREMLTLNDRSHLLQQGISSSNNPGLYLEKFETVEKALANDFYNVFNNFLTNGEFFWLFSADTNN